MFFYNFWCGTSLLLSWESEFTRLFMTHQGGNLRILGSIVFSLFTRARKSFCTNMLLTLNIQRQVSDSHYTLPPAYSFLIASLTISPHNFAVGFALTANAFAISFPYLPPIMKSRDAFSSKSTTDQLASGRLESIRSWVPCLDKCLAVRW